MWRPNGAVFSSMIRAPSSALPLCTRAVGVAAARVAHHRHVVARERGGTDPQERGHESAPKHCRTVDGDDLRADQRHCFVDAVVNHQSRVVGCSSAVTHSVLAGLLGATNRSRLVIMAGSTSSSRRRSRVLPGSPSS